MRKQRNSDIFCVLVNAERSHYCSVSHNFKTWGKVIVQYQTRTNTWPSKHQSLNFQDYSQD